MNQALALAVMALAGVALAVQGPINARLGELMGQLPAAGVSMVVGASVLAVLVLATGDIGRLSGVTEVHPIYLTGGVIGSAYVLMAIATVRLIGAGGLSAAIITGQLAAAVLIADRLGVLGLDKVPVTTQRLLGIGLLILGTMAVVGRR
jgi:transporter family-2 protein